MAVKPIDPEIQQLWIDFKQDQSDQRLRNRLIKQYHQLVKYNAERVWAKLPEGVDLNDLERQRVKSWNEDDLFSLFLGAEEILDQHSPLGCPSWEADDLSEELERWLSESSQQAAQN